MSNPGVYEFYLNRIEASRNYGLVAGDAILETVKRCALHDRMLTEEETDSIIFKCYHMHNKLMEDNFNEGWN